jgi:hypothetical protein
MTVTYMITFSTRLRSHAWFLALLILAGAPRGAIAQGTQTTVDTGLSPRQVLIRLGSAAGEAGGGGPLSNVGEVIADLVGLEISTAPLGSSAGGFTFTFDPVTRTFSRAAPSFGPSFSERAITAGEGRASFGVNFIRATYDSLEGRDLGDGSMQTVSLRDAAGNDLYVGQAFLEITSESTVFFTNIALNNRFDVGLAVPYVRLRVDGRHVMDIEQVRGTGEASGIGDIALRSKLRLIEREGGGFAVGLDLRLPTGDKEALLGAGVTRALFSGIWSGTIGPFAPHASGGFEYWSDPFVIRNPLVGTNVAAGRHGVVYEAGLEWAPSSRVTLNGEVLGRWTRNGARLDYVPLDVRRPNPFDIQSAVVAAASPAGLQRTSLAAGVKWNAFGSALFTASVLIPIRDAGLVDRFTPVFGIDWGF